MNKRTKKVAGKAKRAKPLSSKSVATPTKSRREQAYDQAAGGRLLHDESEADDDGFIDGAGFDRYGGFPGDGLS
jgi:hypothetical protein